MMQYQGPATGNPQLAQMTPGASSAMFTNLVGQQRQATQGAQQGVVDQMGRSNGMGGAGLAAMAGAQGSAMPAAMQTMTAAAGNANQNVMHVGAQNFQAQQHALQRLLDMQRIQQGFDQQQSEQDFTRGQAAQDRSWNIVGSMFGQGGSAAKKGGAF